MIYLGARAVPTVSTPSAKDNLPPLSAANFPPVRYREPGRRKEDIISAIHLPLPHVQVSFFWRWQMSGNWLGRSVTESWKYGVSCSRTLYSSTSYSWKNWRSCLSTLYLRQSHRVPPDSLGPTFVIEAEPFKEKLPLEGDHTAGPLGCFPSCSLPPRLVVQYIFSSRVKMR